LKAAHARKGEQEVVALQLDFGQDPPLLGFEGRVSDSGEGRWSLQAPIEEGVPEPVLSGALTQRFASRSTEDVADKGRYQFGGHEEERS
jgi:6-phosphogluconate dehydrogenase